MKSAGESAGASAGTSRRVAATGGREGRARLAALLGVVGVCVLLLGSIGGLAWLRSGSGGADGPRGGASAAAVEVAPVEVGRLEGRRAYSGALEARSLVTIAPKVAGTVVGLPVDIGDVVERGAVIARLDDAEFVQDAAQAEAQMEVARAQETEAQSAAEIAARDLKRTEDLHARGIASDAQLDQARAEELRARSAVAVAGAQVARARAARQAAEIRLGYATIRAEWDQGEGEGEGEGKGEGEGRGDSGRVGAGERRVVARRFAEEGDTVGANTPLLSVVDLDPITAVFFATQRDYGRLEVGQAVSVTADAFAGETWDGRIERIAPVFDEASRQARIEVRVPNADLRLKPGMFVTARVVLEVARGATIVPADAVTQREGRAVVFVLDEQAGTVSRVPVELGVREGGRVQVVGQAAEGLRGRRVVTLGQQLVGDGSAVTVPGDAGGGDRGEAPAGGVKGGGS
ncbi:MAG: efflux RND transporter periplasmic adaptor subunit [Phycisphaerales bacterium JB059]